MGLRSGAGSEGRLERSKERRREEAADLDRAWTSRRWRAATGPSWKTRGREQETGVLFLAGMFRVGGEGGKCRTQTTRRFPRHPGRPRRRWRVG
eukprot:2244859-Rhodomonas_salina.1